MVMMGTSWLSITSYISFFITFILTMIITLFNVEDNNRLLESVNQSGDHLVFPHQENALLIKMIMTMIVIIIN